MHDTGCKCSAFGVGVPLKHYNTSDETRGLVLGCHGQEARINGLFDLLMNGIYWVHNPLTNPFPNFQQDIQASKFPRSTQKVWNGMPWIFWLKHVRKTGVGRFRSCKKRGYKHRTWNPTKSPQLLDLLPQQVVQLAMPEACILGDVPFWELEFEKPRTPCTCQLFPPTWYSKFLTSCYLPINPEALAFLGLAFLGIVPVGEIACHVVVDTDLLQ